MESIEKHYLINIDSKFRNTEPKNIFDKNQFSPQNITITKDSNIVKIYGNNLNNLFSIGDRFSIKNIEAFSIELTEAFYLIKNFAFLILYFPNHQINSDYQKYYNIFQIVLDEIDDEEKATGNIPINFLNNFHQVFLIKNNQIIADENYDIPLSFLTGTELSKSELENNYLAIRLPFVFISDKDYVLIKELVKIRRTEFGGIPISYLNADYPVNTNQRQGYHVIKNVTKNYLEFETSYKAYKSEIISNSKIIVAKIIDEISAFPEISEYTIRLKRTLNNVKQIELLSSEFPNTTNVVMEYPVSMANNKLYWQNLDDGNFIYSVSIPEGNYSQSSLLETLTSAMNNVERINSTSELSIFNNFSLEFNAFTQEFVILPLKEDILSNALFVSSINIDGITRTVLEVFHPNNNVEVGDNITIENSRSIGEVPATVINQTHQVYSTNQLNESYRVILPAFNRRTVTQDETNTAGGEEIKIISKGFSRFLFNRNDTLGNVLGFRDVGRATSITPFISRISNKGKYINEENFDLNQVGKPRNPVTFLNLTGDNRYFLIYLNDYEEIVTNTSAPNCFAKILLDGNPGEYIYDSFVNFPIKFDYPIATISQLSIRITYPDGSLVNFGNVNHSFTLKFTEVQYTNDKINIDSKTTNIYRDTKFTL
jgi:hypothetical protein